ncbi:MAG: hypothetical protein KDD92_13395 [Caldilineaceae bacterium]|nr:hypothetical protein [Caldilineaceae bacterium]
MPHNAPLCIGSARATPAREYISIDPIEVKSKENRRNQRRELHRCLLFLLLFSLTGCAAPLLAPAPPQKATPSPPAAAFLSGDQALPALVAAERTASRTGDAAQLAQLWHETSRVIDGRNTASPDDDYVWQGRDAVLDRYVTAVFPAPPPPASFENLEIIIEGERASGRNGGDHWRFIYADGRWWLAELRYQ